MEKFVKLLAVAAVWRAVVIIVEVALTGDNHAFVEDGAGAEELESVISVGERGIGGFKTSFDATIKVVGAAGGIDGDLAFDLSVTGTATVQIAAVVNIRTA